MPTPYSMSESHQDVSGTCGTVTMSKRIKQGSRSYALLPQILQPACHLWPQRMFKAIVAGFQCFSQHHALMLSSDVLFPKCTFDMLRKHQRHRKETNVH